MPSSANGWKLKPSSNLTETRGIQSFSPHKMHSTLLTIVNGVCIGVCYLLMGLGSRSTWGVVSVITAVLFTLNKVSLRELFQLRIPHTSKALHYAWYGFLLYSALHLIRTFVEYQLVPEKQSNPWGGYDVVLKNLTFSLVLLGTFTASKRVGFREALCALVIAIGTAAAANLVFEKAGLFPNDNIFGESRFEGLEARWRPPVIRSNAYFAMSCTVAFGLSMLICRGYLKEMLLNPLLLSCTLIAAATSAIASIKCQFRAHALAVLAAFALLALRTALSLRIAGVLMISLMVLFPALFITDAGYGALEALTPDRLLQAVGSRSDGSQTLSDRTYLYHYGWENLGDTRIFLIGQGPVLRDAQPAIGDLPMEGYRMPYHAAFLDFTMHTGLPLAILIVAGMLFTLWHSCNALRRTTNSGVKSDLHLGVANLLLWLSLSIIDSGLSNYETMWMAVLPTFAAIQAAALASTGLKIPKSRVP